MDNVGQVVLGAAVTSAFHPMSYVKTLIQVGSLISNVVVVIAGHFVTRSFRHNLRSFRHSQFVTPELPNQRRFGCPALYYYHDNTMGQSLKQLQRLLTCFKFKTKPLYRC